MTALSAASAHPNQSASSPNPATQNLGTSQTLAKGLILLELVAERQGADGAGLVELARALNWNKSTTHRLLSTLVAHGFLQQEPGHGRFRLGLKAFHLGIAFSRDLELRNEALPILTEVKLRTEHTTSLVILEPPSGEVVFIESVGGTRPLRMHTYVGMRFPVNCTAAGKAIMAHLPEDELDHLLRRELLSQTPSSIVSPDDIRAQLPVVRERGFATDNQENAEGVRCVAAPILDHRGYPVAAISISGASIQIPLDEFSRLGPIVRRAADTVSRSLGGQM